MKKILILGASGFIGKNLREFFDDIYEIFAPSHHELDVLDEDCVKAYLQRIRFDVVLNALDRRSDKTIPNAYYVYALERLRMFEILAKYSDHYGKMLYFGTGAEYGRALPIERISEDSFGRVAPQDPYGFTMYTMSNLALQRKNIYNFRLFGIFGKHELYKERFISNAICKSLLSYPITIRQNAKFDYLHIDDLCKMVHYFIENNMLCKCYNATSGISRELLELADIIKTVVNNVPVYIAKGGYKNEYTSNNTLIMRELGRFKLGDIKSQISELASFYEAHMQNLDRESLLYNSN
jgi:GDP-L-fucose synthase